jgi:Domain of unknown function (DUF5076)
MMRQLAIPEVAVDDANSVELIRVWVAHHGLHCSIHVGMYEGSKISEERAWGVILADTARHVANALKAGYNKDADAVLEKIREHFLFELDGPTSGAKGSFVSEN